MLASFADANTSDRQEAVAADRDIPGEPHWDSFSACVALVSGSGRVAEYLVHRLHQRQCDAARGELRLKALSYNYRPSDPHTWKMSAEVAHHPTWLSR